MSGQTGGPERAPAGSTRPSVEPALDSGSDGNLFRQDLKPIAVFGLLAGGPSTVLFILLLLSPPASSAQQQLHYVADHTALVIVFEFTVILWATLSAPFAFGLGTLLRGSSRAVARSASGLSAFGILLLGFATYASYGGLLAINAAGAPPTAGGDVYLASFWSQLGYLLTDPPLMAWGVGQLMFASLAWTTRRLPRWLAVVGGVSGLSLLLGSLDTPSQAIFLIGVGILAFAVWSLGVAVLMFRRGD